MSLAADRGWMVGPANYTTWFTHGETTATFQHGESRDLMEDDNNVDECKRMVVDEVKLTSEVFRWKSKNKRIKLALPETDKRKFMERLSIKHFRSSRSEITWKRILLSKMLSSIVYRLFDDLTRQQQSNIDDAGRDIYRQKGAEWFDEHVRQSEGKVKKLSGVCVRGSVSNGYQCDYYGILDEILGVKYRLHCSYVLFKCKWFDIPGGVGVKRKDNLVYINPKAKLLIDNPCVFPSYTEQVYYVPDSLMSKE
ncbi:transposon, En/Spm-like, transposase-associated domain protein [Tanacetum coccineum]